MCVATVWGKNLSAGPASQAAGNHGAPTYYFPTLDISEQNQTLLLDTHTYYSPTLDIFEQNQTLLLDAQNTTIEHTKPLITIRHFDIIYIYIQYYLFNFLHFLFDYRSMIHFTLDLFIEESLFMFTLLSNVQCTMPKTGQNHTISFFK